MMATFNVYITESKTYETTVEAASAEAAIAAGATVDTSSFTANIDKSVTARPA
jgi:hypothetical protein